MAAQEIENFLETANFNQVSDSQNMELDKENRNN